MPRGAIPEYPPILTGTVEQQMVQLREYLIRNIDTLVYGLSGGGSGGLTVSNGSVYIDQTGTGDLITLQEWITNNVHIDGSNVYITNNNGDQVTIQEFITNSGDTITVNVGGDTTTTLQEFITNASEYITVNVDGDTITLQEYITNLAEQLDDFEVKSNKVQAVSSSSTAEQYPSARCVWNMVGDIESALAALIGS